jgi:hypothetical protein
MAGKFSNSPIKILIPFDPSRHGMNGIDAFLEKYSSEKKVMG